jgi:hypothetical protein
MLFSRSEGVEVAGVPRKSMAMIMSRQHFLLRLPTLNHVNERLRMCKVLFPALRLRTRARRISFET